MTGSIVFTTVYSLLCSSFFYRSLMFLLSLSTSSCRFCCSAFIPLWSFSIYSFTLEKTSFYSTESSYVGIIAMKPSASSGSSCSSYRQNLIAPSSSTVMLVINCRLAVSAPQNPALLRFTTSVLTKSIRLIVFEISVCTVLFIFTLSAPGWLREKKKTRVR